MIQYVCGFAFWGCEVALVTKAKPAGKLNGIGGEVEVGESLIEAMRRKFLEETKIDREQWDYFLTLHTKGSRVHFFRTELVVRATLLGLEAEPVNWYDIESVRAGTYIIPNLSWILPMARMQYRAEVWE